jgi:hypothetical protein
LEFKESSIQHLYDVQLNQFFEFRRRKSGIRGNCAHRKRVDGIMPGNGQPGDAIRHDYMFAVPDDPKTGFFQGPNSLFTTDIGNLGHFRPSLRLR